jgi:glycosyltransferase involved in cell wall biosynthesis
MFKVLILAYYFPPMGLTGVQRTLRLSKYMTGYNWSPTIITTGSKEINAIDLSLMNEAEESGIRIIRTDPINENLSELSEQTIKLSHSIKTGWFKKFLNSFYIPDDKKPWANKAYLVAKELLTKEKFDIIFVPAPPFSAFELGAKLKREFDIPLFVDYRSLWYGNQYNLYPTIYHLIKQKNTEYNCLRAAERVIVVNRRIKEKLLTTFKFLSFDDIVIIPHGFDGSDYTDNKKFPKENSKFILTYTGLFIDKITPKYFLTAFKELSIERPDITQNIELNFVGTLSKKNQALIKQLKLQENVKEFGYLTHSEAVRRIISSDALWMMISKVKNADTVTVGKMFEYFGSQKPVIACVPEGAAKTSAQEYGAAYIAEPDNIMEIKSAITKLHEDFQNNKLPVANPDFIKKHDRRYLTEILTKEFQFFIKEIV